MEILKEYYSTTAKYDLVEIFGKIGRNRTWLSIFKKANKLGLKKITHKEAIDKILRENLLCTLKAASQERRGY